MKMLGSGLARRLGKRIRGWTRGQFAVVLIALLLVLGWAEWKRTELSRTVDAAETHNRVEADCNRLLPESVAYRRCVGNEVQRMATNLNDMFAAENNIDTLGWLMVWTVAVALILSWIHYSRPPSDSTGAQIPG